MIFRRPRLISSLVPIEITRAITACMRCVQADPQANPKAGKRAEERAEQSVGVQARGLEKMRALNEQLGRMGRAALEIILPHGCLAAIEPLAALGRFAPRAGKQFGGSMAHNVTCVGENSPLILVTAIGVRPVRPRPQFMMLR